MQKKKKKKKKRKKEKEKKTPIGLKKMYCNFSLLQSVTNRLKGTNIYQIRITNDFLK